jgi:endonuclease VIII
MNQTIVSGVGNVYKSEVLFLEQLNPFARVEDLTDEVLLRVVRRGAELMRRNVQGGARTTRFGLDGHRLWVYGRSGKPCLKCGTTLQMRRQGDLGRSTYWCPACQVRPLLTPP